MQILPFHGAYLWNAQNFLGRLRDITSRRAENYPLIPMALGISGILEKNPLLQIVGACMMSFQMTRLCFLSSESLPLAKEVAHDAEEAIQKLEKGEGVDLSQLRSKIARLHKPPPQEAITILEKWSTSTPEEKKRASLIFQDLVPKIGVLIKCQCFFAIAFATYATHLALCTFKRPFTR